MSSTSTTSRNAAVSCGADSTAARSTTPPCCVNFTALARRLCSTCRSFVSSVTMKQGCWHNCVPRASAGSFSSARILNITSKSLSNSPRSKVDSSKEILLASIFEISRISVISDSRCSPLRMMVLTNWLCCSVRSRSRRRSWANPRMAFIGVRISWDMLARNRLFARFALSAATLASSSSLVRWATKRSRCS